MIGQPPFQTPLQNGENLAPIWIQFIQRVRDAIAALTASGATGGRPVKGLYVGQVYFDTTINQPVWWNGDSWVTW